MSINVQPKTQLIGANQTAPGQFAQQRLAVDQPAVGRAGSQNQAIDRQGNALALSQGQGKRQGTSLALQRRQPCGQHLQAPLALTLLNHLGDLRRNAITMHIPVTPQMTQEALTVGKRQGLPDALSLLTYRVQHHLPGKPLLCRAEHIGAHQPQPLTERALIVLTRPGRRSAAGVAPG